ncbi:MAG: diaminopimelate epimerase [Acidiferrobacterales bacterium]
MLIPFTKMQGAGNDFVVFDAVSQRVDLTPERVRRIARRRLGVGCDQVLVVAPTDRSDADFRVAIYNADGSQAEHCGNGLRCIARFVRDRGLSGKDAVTMATLAGMIQPRIETDGQVTIDMGVPEFDPAKVPFEADTQQLVYDLDIGGESIAVSVLSLGNPHAVQLVDELDDSLVAQQGPLIENHPRFPNRVNVGFMKILNPRRLRLRVHERGVGETLACGSGATAAVVAGCWRELLETRVDVDVPGGSLTVSWAGEGQPAYLKGPAVATFEGNIDLDRL